MANLKSLALCSCACLLFVNVSWAEQAAPDAISAPVAASGAQSAPLAVKTQTDFPVLLADAEIIVISTSPLGSLKPENRAQLIQQNIQTFADSDVDAGSLRVIELPEGLGIGNDASLLMVIVSSDAEKTGKAPAVLAKEVLERIQAAVGEYRTKHSWKTYGFGAGFTVLAIIGLWFVLHWNNRVFAWLAVKEGSLDGYWKAGVRFKNINVLSAERIETIILSGLRTLRFIIILLCWYFFLLLTLSFFPETRKLSSRILDYLITPFAKIFHTVIGYIPNFFFIFVIGVVAFYVLKLISYVFKLIERGELKFEWFHDDWARPTYQIVRFLVIVTALISAYPYIPGSSSQAFQGVGLVLGAIISFASSSAISNIVAGVILTYTRAFKLNDRVKIGETIGDVVEKTLLVTRIQTIKLVVVTIPNSLVMGSQIVNYSTSAAAGDGMILHTSVTIGYDVPWKTVHALLIDAAQSTDKIMQKPDPFVLQTSLDDWYVSYEINAYTKEPERMAIIYSELHRNIQDKFDAAGVEIMSPHYLTLRDGNASTVPSILGGKGYTPPPFQVTNI